MFENTPKFADSGHQKTCRKFPRSSLRMVDQKLCTNHSTLAEWSFGSNGLLKIANKSNGSMYRFNVSRKINVFFLFISRELNDSFAIDDNDCCPQRENVSSTQYLIVQFLYFVYVNMNNAICLQILVLRFSLLVSLHNTDFQNKQKKNRVYYIYSIVLCFAVSFFMYEH